MTEAEKLAPNTVAYWRLLSVIYVLPWAIVVMGGGLLVLRDPIQEPLGWGIVAAGVVLLIVGLLRAAIWPALRYQRYQFSLRESGLRIQWGVWTHHEMSVPFGRVQHLDIGRGPLERIFGLAHLVIFTSGGRAATAVLPGLTVDRATALREHVLRAANAHIQITPAP